jgi:hypothetical protein
MEEIFYEKNGFDLKDSFSSIVDSFISKIPNESEYYFDMFEYDNLFWVIPIHRGIAEQGGILQQTITKYPSFGTSVTMATYGSIIEGFFNPRYFVKMVIGILHLLALELGVETKIKNPVLLELKNIAKNMPKHSFFNTHQTVFNYFKFYDIVWKSAFEKIGEIFCSIGFPLSDDFFNRYLGFSNGNFIGRNLDGFRKIGVCQSEGSVDDLPFGDGFQHHFDFLGDINSGKLNFLKDINSYDAKYLKANFSLLDFNSSYNIFIKGDVYDDLLENNVSRYFVADGVYITKGGIVASTGKKTIYKTKYHENLSVFGFSSYQSGLLPFNAENIRFDETLKEISTPQYGLSSGNFSVIKTVVLPREMETIGDSFFGSLGTLTNIEMPEKVKTIGSYFLSGVYALKKIEIKDVEKIGYGFLENSNLEEIEFDSPSLEDIGNSFLCNMHKLSKIDIFLPKLKEIPDFCMIRCKMLRTARFIFPELQKIGFGFMRFCDVLENFTLMTGENFRKIGDNFLIDCQKLSSFQMDVWPTDIGDAFLSGAASLKKLDNVFGSRTFKIGKNFLKNAVSLEEFNQTCEPRYIGEGFLEGCSSLIIKKTPIEDSSHVPERSSKSSTKKTSPAKEKTPMEDSSHVPERFSKLSEKDREFAKLFFKK